MAAPLRDPAPLDRSVFDEAYRRHHHRAVLAARRVLGDDPRAEDAAQDAFVRLWRNPGGYDPSRADLGTYVALMARSRAIDLWRSERSLERAAQRLEAVSGRGDDPRDPEELALREEVRRTVRRAMRGLPEPQRQALALAHWGDLTISDIAARTGVPLGTVKGRLRLGLAKLAATVPAA